MDMAYDEGRTMRRYVIGTFVWNIVFAALVVAIDKLLDPSINAWPPAASLPLVVLTCLPLLGWGYEMRRYIAGLDELQALVQLRAAALAGLIALFAGALAGVAEIYGALDPVNPALLMPIAAAAHSIAVVVQGRRLG